MKELLRVDNISYRNVLKNISFSIDSGEVVGVYGQNNAGKSVLAGILTGTIKQNSGNIFMYGKKCNHTSPQEAIHKGIGYIRQEPDLLMNLNVAENLMISGCISTGVFFSQKKLIKEANNLLNKHNICIDVERYAYQLSLFERHLIEFVRIINSHSNLIIMDEPTSSLSNDEVNILLNKIIELKKQNISFLFISHRINDLIRVCDRVVIIHKGLCVSIAKNTHKLETILNNIFTYEKNINYLSHQPINNHNNKPAIRVCNLSSNKQISNVSFSINYGETVGITGLLGSGRTEIANLLYGIEEIKSGHIFVDEKEVLIKTPASAIRNGIGLVPEERKLNVLISEFNVKQNISLGILSKISTFGIINSKREDLMFDRIECLSLNEYSDKNIATLGGGILGKISIAKCLINKPKLIIFDDPFRGLDILNRNKLVKLLRELRVNHAIIIISSEFEDMMGLVDRVLVFNKGSIRGELCGKQFTQDNLLSLLLS